MIIAGFNHVQQLHRYALFLLPKLLSLSRPGLKHLLHQLFGDVLEALRTNRLDLDDSTNSEPPNTKIDLEVTKKKMVPQYCSKQLIIFPSSFSILSFHQVSVFDMPDFPKSQYCLLLLYPRDQTLGPLGLASGSSGWSASVSNLEGSGLGVGETPSIAGLLRPQPTWEPGNLESWKGDFFWTPIHFQVSMLDFWGCLGIKHSSSTTTPTSATGIRCWICCKSAYKSLH